VPFDVKVRSILRHLTVGLLAVHLLAITLAALPSPAGGLNRRDWAQPTVQAEFDAWASRLSALGIVVGPDALQDHVFAFAVAYHEVHRRARAPFEPYYRTCGTHQTWRMFVAPHRFPARLQVRVHGPSGWALAFEERHPQARWLADQLGHDRFRSAIFRYGWGTKYASAWRGFGDWIARRAALDYPDADRIEVRFLQGRTLRPDEVRAGVQPETRVHRPRQVRLARFR